MDGYDAGRIAERRLIFEEHTSGAVTEREACAKLCDERALASHNRANALELNGGSIVEIAIAFAERDAMSSLAAAIRART